MVSDVRVCLRVVGEVADVVVEARLWE